MTDMQNMKIELTNVKRKIVVMSGKGGVGKSTVSANLAYELARRGNRVGLLDADIHGPTIPKLFGQTGESIYADEKGRIMPLPLAENLVGISIGMMIPDQDSPIVWRGPLKFNMIKKFIEEVEWGNLDYLIFDLPPGTGDEPLSIGQLISGIDGSIIVTTPQDVALVSVRKSFKFAKMLEMPVLGIVENMAGLVCPHCGKEIELFRRGGASKAAEEFETEILGTIPFDVEAAYKADEGKPFTAGDGPASLALRKAVDRIEKKL